MSFFFACSECGHDSRGFERDLTFSSSVGLDAWENLNFLLAWAHHLTNPNALNGDLEEMMPGVTFQHKLNRPCKGKIFWARTMKLEMVLFTGS